MTTALSRSFDARHRSHRTAPSPKPRNRRALLTPLRQSSPASLLALLLLAVWSSARVAVKSEKVIPRERMRTAVVERGPFVRDVAATGTRGGGR